MTTWTNLNISNISLNNCFFDENAMHLRCWIFSIAMLYSLFNVYCHVAIGKNCWLVLNHFGNHATFLLFFFKIFGMRTLFFDDPSKKNNNLAQSAREKHFNCFRFIIIVLSKISLPYHAHKYGYIVDSKCVYCIQVQIARFKLAHVVVVCWWWW